MELHLLSGDQIPLDLLNKLYQAIEQEERDEHIKENMIGDVSWSLKSYIKYRTRFFSPQGAVVYLVDKGEIVALSCMEKNDSLIKNAALIGVRMWVKKDYRRQFLHTLHLLPAQEKWAQSQGLTRVFMTFNVDSRKSLYFHIINRDHSGGPYEDRWQGYQSFGQVEFNHTPQYVIYKEL